MKFIRKKNLMDGEDVLYVPQLHWIYAVKPLIYSLPFFLLLFIAWAMDKTFMGNEIVLLAQVIIKNTFIAGVLAILLVFVYRIFLFVYNEYGVTNKRLIVRKGIIRLVVAEIPFDRIESIYCVQGILGRIFHYGTVYIAGIGGRVAAFSMVYRPYALRRVIVDIMEKNKAITVVHGDLPRPKSTAKPQAAQQEPLYRYGTFVRVLPGSDNR